MHAQVFKTGLLNTFWDAEEASGLRKSESVGKREPKKVDIIIMDDYD